MRTNLIMHFHCSECGKILNVCYAKEAKKPVYNSSNTEKDPTGALCMYPEKISVEPCKACIDTYTIPAKKLMDALEDLKK